MAEYDFKPTPKQKLKITREKFSEFLKRGSYELIKEFLKDHSEEAYTRSGIMINVFNVNENDAQVTYFSDMPKGLPALYNQIAKILRRLEAYGFVSHKRIGRRFYYIWNEERDGK